MSNNYPYLARSTIRYKSPHPTDLSFAKDETIRVVGPSPDDEDWLLGESIDGSRSGGFPRDFVVKVEDESAQPSTSADRPTGEAEAVQAPLIAQPSNTSEGAFVTRQPETVISFLPQEAAETHQDDDLAEQTERLNIGTESNAAPSNAPIAEPIAAPVPRAVPPQSTAQPLGSSPAPAITSQATDSPDKPQSFKDKLAAFNRSATSGSGPPPPLKPKPLGASGGVGTWAWKQKQQQAAAAEGTAKAQPAEPTSEQLHPAPIANREADDSAQHPTPAAAPGMSASDAKASIAAGGSLRERMAALAGAGAFGSDKPKGPPPPIASKPRVWKRPEQPVAAEPTPGSGEDDVEQTGPSFGAPHPTAVRSDSAGPATEQQDRATEGDEQGQGKDDDEAQKEKERRAAIAARMARLGGRGVMGMPMPIGGPKPVARQAETEHTEDAVVSDQTNNESKAAGEESNVATSSLEQGATLSSAEGAAPESATSPPATIAMPAIPRKAGPPRRKPPTRTDTGGSGISAAASSPVVHEGTSVPLSSEAPAEPSTVPESTPNRPIQREEIPSPTCEGDDRETPLPKTEEELAKEREYEEAGRGPRGAEGAERAGIALATVSGSAQADETGDQAPDSHNEAPLHHERSLPPPPPPADDEDDFGEPDDEEDDGDANDDIMKQAAFGGLLSRSTNAPESQTTVGTAQPVDFQPLQSPASTTGALPETSSLQQTVFSPPSAPQNLLGLPKDEVEMKREGESIGDAYSVPPPLPRTGGDTNDEGERIKPAGPRPLPPSPARGLPPLQVPNNPPSSSLATQQPISPLSEAQANASPSAPLPTRQASMRSATPTGPSHSVDEAETARSPVQQPRVQVAQEAEQAIISPEDADAVRRQGIAARMAKLGGIKLGGPPLGGFQGQATSPGASPLSPSFQTRNEVLASPTSPVAPTLQSSQSAADNEEETEEQAAKRRQATLARLRAGGALGFGMFNNSAPAEETPVDASPVDASPVETSSQHIPPPMDSTTGEIHAAAMEALPAGSTEAVPSHVQEPQHSREMPPIPVDEAEDDEDEPAPPPPPRRSLSIKSPVTSPIVPAAAAMPSIHGPSRAVPPSGEDTTDDAPVRGIAPPLPAMPAGQYVHEPETMEETQEASDEMGPPPPPRVREETSLSRSSMDRSESRASRVSMSSMGSDRGMPPASPVSGVRRSMSGVRPGYNELREAAKTYGAKVARAAGKLLESSKKHAIGDGGPRALVWTAMAEAGLDANTNFGTMIWEQQGPTIQQRLDDIHVGDIVVLHDVKLKGKKGLLSYTQQAGSVQEPVFAVCSHVEDKKTKIKVYQYERGHGDNITYRLDDLQSGLVRIFRPMP